MKIAKSPLILALLLFPSALCFAGGTGTRGGGDECRIEFRAFVVATARWLAENRADILKETKVDIQEVLTEYERRGLAQQVTCLQSDRENGPSPLFDEFGNRVTAFSDSSTATTQIFVPWWRKLTQAGRPALTMHEVFVLLKIETTSLTTISSFYELRSASTPGTGSDGRSILSARNLEAVCAGSTTSGPGYYATIELQGSDHSRVATLYRQVGGQAFLLSETFPVTNYYDFMSHLRSRVGSDLSCPVMVPAPPPLSEVSLRADPETWQFLLRGRVLGKMVFTWLSGDQEPTAEQAFSKGDWKCWYYPDQQESAEGPYQCIASFRDGKFVTDPGVVAARLFEAKGNVQAVRGENYTEITITDLQGLQMFGDRTRGSHEIKCGRGANGTGGLESCTLRIFRDGHIEAP